jgi:hypothetical protein
VLWFWREIRVQIQGCAPGFGWKLEYRYRTVLWVLAEIRVHIQAVLRVLAENWGVGGWVGCTPNHSKNKSEVCAPFMGKYEYRVVCLAGKAKYKNTI